MKATIIVQNLKCGGCANTITKKVSEIEKVSDVFVDKDQSKITFECPSETEVNHVKSTLKAIGYPSMDEDNSLMTKMKSMVSCATGKISQ
ncbi:MAG: heavy metal-associated domain-containing protein [Flavobacteriaceae bacterium]|nr:heavy-metal-associated domain-containing protein [Mangrovimonas sp.]MCB0427168.1 heavy-metal-associated domain-containing protein [Mangrovimonas sp.]MCB0435217.1 heavy-metal-associated domain-containing protein [Mangrovimonas sp.]MCB0438050.1 heavy-metal-associated domain-containing protein [Mangrovimonas sp.]HPF95899.1 heavy metal-associated domain-containing protein [Mangrovimonas sp.]